MNKRLSPSTESLALCEYKVESPVDPAYWKPRDILIVPLMKNYGAAFILSQEMHMMMESEARSESITGNRPVRYIVGNLLMCIMYGARKYAQALRELCPPCSLFCSVLACGSGTKLG